MAKMTKKTEMMKVGFQAFKVKKNCGDHMFPDFCFVCVHVCLLDNQWTYTRSGGLFASQFTSCFGLPFKYCCSFFSQIMMMTAMMPWSVFYLLPCSIK